MTLDTFPTIAECSLRCLWINMLSMIIRSHTSAVQRNNPGILCMYIHFKDTRTPHSEPRPVLIEVSLIATHFSSATFVGLNRLFQCGKRNQNIPLLLLQRSFFCFEMGVIFNHRLYILKARPLLKPSVHFKKSPDILNKSQIRSKMRW